MPPKSHSIGPATVLRRALTSSAVATLASTAALALASRAEGAGAAQPLNATSHWLYGEVAATFPDTDVDHTPIGVATHAAATLLWATAFETALALRPSRSPASILGRAAAIGAMAAIVDYTITPKRFTPGWELVLSKRSMAVVYATMAAGFAAVAIART